MFVSWKLLLIHWIGWLGIAINVVCNLILYELWPLTVALGWCAMKDKFVLVIHVNMDAFQFSKQQHDNYEWMNEWMLVWKWSNVLNAEDESNEMIPSIWSTNLASWLARLAGWRWNFEREKIIYSYYRSSNNSTLIGPNQPLCQCICTMDIVLQMWG